MTELGWLTAAPFAHRGLHDHGRGIPENSVTAFAAAAEAGFPIELDVHRSADGHAVVVHDRRLLRLTGRPLRVDRTPWSALADLRLLETEERIPLLGDVLDLVAGRVGVMVEIKNTSRRVGPIERAVADVLAGYGGPVCVASFNPGTIAWFASNRPEVIRGQTAGPMEDVPMPGWVRVAMARMIAATRMSPHFISYDLRGLPDPMVERRRGERPLITWTVRTSEDLEKARTLADNFIFEGLEVPRPGPGTQAIG